MDGIKVTCQCGRILTAPASHAGKIAAFTLMGHKKYSAQRRAVAKKIHPDKKLIL